MVFQKDLRSSSACLSDAAVTAPQANIPQNSILTMTRGVKSYQAVFN